MGYTYMKVVATRPSNLEALNRLKVAGHELAVGREPGSLSREPFTEGELIELAHDADALLVGQDLITRAIMEQASKLKLVIVPFIGTDKIDKESATDVGVMVANSPTPENFLSVAEVTVAQMLNLLMQTKYKESELRAGRWGASDVRGAHLFGKTIGIVGLGRIGKGVAARLANWDVDLLAYDPYVTQEAANTVGVTMTDLDTLLADSDIITLHAVATEETHKMIGEAQFRAMKPTAYFLNLARGELVDEAALHKALAEDWIAGSALDSFYQEPLPPESPLRRLNPEHVLLTPHNASHSNAARAANLELAIDQILALGRGEVPEHVVNQDVIPTRRVD
jgi:D-3-phosphoglycerate dehydrogenase